VNSDVPAELADVVDRLLSKNPADRFRDAQEVERQLESILMQLQNRQRSSRIRWRRIWLRWRHVICKFAIMTGVIGICVMIGFGLAFWNISVVSTPIAVPTPLAEPLQRADSIRPVARAEQSETVSPSIITLPPDTFERDLAETRNLLDAISEHWNSRLEATERPDSESEKWSEQVNQILEQLNQ